MRYIRRKIVFFVSLGEVSSKSANKNTSNQRKKREDVKQ